MIIAKDIPPSFEERLQKAIPARWHMISGSADSQTSADVQNVSQFQLPNPAGRPGGACTSAFLEVMYKDETIPAEQPSWVSVLTQMREVLKELGYDQVRRPHERRQESSWTKARAQSWIDRLLHILLRFRNWVRQGTLMSMNPSK